MLRFYRQLLWKTHPRGLSLRRQASSITEPPAYVEAMKKSLESPEEFWNQAAQDIDWFEPPKTILDTSNPPFYRWFKDARANVSYNALDRHLEIRGDQNAISYISPVTDTVKHYTYAELHAEVERMAGMLSGLGVQTGDRVVIYMPMIPETCIAMLACARIGAIHSVVFGGFAANELAVRIDDASPKVILTASCGLEGMNKIVQYKPLLDKAIDLAEHKPQHCVVYQRPHLEANLIPGRDLDWEQALSQSSPVGAVELPGDHPLYILYTSGTTGKPKGVVRDTAGGMVALNWSMKYVYDQRPGDVWWAASDLGWVVGHSYILYAPLLYGCTSILYEGKPVGTPDAGIFWRTIREQNVRSLFTAPTAIRAIKKEDPDAKLLEGGLGPNFDALFLAGERTDPTTVKWLQEAMPHIPVIDHYWQTEFGWPTVANCKGLGLFPVKAGSSTKPVPGWNLRVLHPHHGADEDEYYDLLEEGHGTVRDDKNYDDGYHTAGVGELGPLVIKLPLPPGTLLSLWNDDARYKKSYIEKFPGYFQTGDACYVDEDGYINIMCRTDDVINVAGHRLSTGTMEAVLASHRNIAEAAVVARKDEAKGEIPVGFVVMNDRPCDDIEALKTSLVDLVRQEIGPIAAFKEVVVVPRLPKTRSGKVLRATLRAQLNNQPFRLPPTIDDPAIVDEVQAVLTQEGYARKE